MISYSHKPTLPVENPRYVNVILLSIREAFHDQSSLFNAGRIMDFLTVLYTVI